MRVFKQIFGGITVEPVRESRGLSARLLLIGLPVMAVMLGFVFFCLWRNTAAILESIASRNSLLQAQAMSRAVENVLRETRNQLLLLAAGPVDEAAMRRAARRRADRDGEIFREVGFFAIDLAKRFLLVNHQGAIINVPHEIARESFVIPQPLAGELPPASQVSLSLPLEINYPLVPVEGGIANVNFQAIRFSTPVYDETSQFQGILSLGIDLAAFRNALGQFMEEGLRGFFFDNDGWLVMQAYAEAGVGADSESARSGFRGDFGRPGFSHAFRPAPEHLNYWLMVSDAQAGNAGNITAPLHAPLEDASFNNASGASYAPVFWREHLGQPGEVIGGVALLSDGSANLGFSRRLFWSFAYALAASLLLIGFGLWRLSRKLATPLQNLSTALENCADGASCQPLSVPAQPAEFRRLTSAVNNLVERMAQAHAKGKAIAHAENQQLLRKPVPGLPFFAPDSEPRLIGDSVSMQSLRELIDKAAHTEADVLISGETGTGKELVATSIHNLSSRKDGPFISINCGALDEALLMDTLFGHVKGAYTEAKASRKGAFLAATGGTLLLDEIGNATPQVQQALLRALSTRHIRPLGSDTDVAFDARIIAATNANLQDARRGFRSDLYYRLAVIGISTSPLRERKEDIPSLVAWFLSRESKAAISRGAMAKLTAYDWPGNVRELKNIIIRALAFSDGKLIMAEDIRLDSKLPDEQATPEKQSYAILPPKGLNPRQAALWERLVAMGSFTRQEYERMAGAISPRTAQYDLKLMLDLGLLVRKGAGPGSRYTVIAGR